jgi:DNA-binding beta-propeller fold protein YncE
MVSINILPPPDAFALTTYTTSFSISDETTAPDDIAFNSDGTKMFVLGGRNIYEYTLTTGFDLSTASYSGNNMSTASQDMNPNGFAFNSDGTKLFVAGATNDKIFEYSLTAFDLSNTVTYSGNSQVLMLEIQ